MNEFNEIYKNVSIEFILGQIDTSNEEKFKQQIQDAFPINNDKIYFILNKCPASSNSTNSFTDIIIYDNVKNSNTPISYFANIEQFNSITKKMNDISNEFNSFMKNIDNYYTNINKQLLETRNNVIELNNSIKNINEEYSDEQSQKYVNLTEITKY